MKNFFKSTIVTAQHLSEDLKKTAVKESEVLVSEAEVKAEKILAASHRRAAKLAQDIREMRLLRVRLGTTIRAAIDTYLSLLDGLSQDDPEDRRGRREGLLSHASRAGCRVERGLTRPWCVHRFGIHGRRSRLLDLCHAAGPARGCWRSSWRRTPSLRHRSSRWRQGERSLCAGARRSLRSKAARRRDRPGREGKTQTRAPPRRDPGSWRRSSRSWRELPD